MAHLPPRDIQQWAPVCLEAELARNRLTSLPASFGSLAFLTKLDLSDNNLQARPRRLRGCLLRLGPTDGAPQLAPSLLHRSCLRASAVYGPSPTWTSAATPSASCRTRSAHWSGSRASGSRATPSCAFLVRVRPTCTPPLRTSGPPVVTSLTHTPPPLARAVRRNLHRAVRCRGQPHQRGPALHRASLAPRGPTRVLAHPMHLPSLQDRFSHLRTLLLSDNRIKELPFEVGRCVPA